MGLHVTCKQATVSSDASRRVCVCLQERVLHGRALKLAATCVTRFSNTYLGSAMWVACARLGGLQ